ncbi:putative Prostasin [Hypsibius exemplaris]|uniref:Prostasin n=1 Tax=Hypsibius exemplaris TaxID=2072580 RepID=A0A1W0WEA7_HYPEX|nr:putative Prostasin [Hypsibius exemplaris]
MPKNAHLCQGSKSLTLTTENAPIHLTGLLWAIGTSEGSYGKNSNNGYGNSGSGGILSLYNWLGSDLGLVMNELVATTLTTTNYNNNEYSGSNSYSTSTSSTSGANYYENSYTTSSSSTGASTAGSTPNARTTTTAKTTTTASGISSSSTATTRSSSTTTTETTKSTTPKTTTATTTTAVDVLHCGSVGVGSNSDLFPQNGLNKRFFGRGIAGQVLPTIVGGMEAVRNQLCWQVTLSNECGGTILGPRTILSAAHCFFEEKGGPQNAFKDTFTVQTGALHRNDGSANDPTGCADTFGVAALQIHEEYNWANSNNDIALITLDRDIQFEGKPCVCRACLRDLEPSVGDVCITSGTGDEITEDPSKNPPMKFVDLQVLKNESPACAFNTDKVTQVETDPNLFVCAGGVEGKDSCQGDSGGPLVCLDKDNLFYSAATVSFGDGCGGNVGGQYTKTKSYLPWIKTNALPEILP